MASDNAPLELAPREAGPIRAIGRSWRVLVFGATGAIGGAVVRQAVERGWDVVAVTRATPPATGGGGARWIGWDPIAARSASALAGEPQFDAVVWAQGQNMADDLTSFDADRHLDLYRANVVLVMQSAAALLDGGLLRAGGAKLVVISSIWQERARDNKLSYTVTKAALGGLVRSASVDLGRDGHLINAVLPGVTDTPMTRANMSGEQIGAVAAKTGHARLTDLDTVVDTVLFLASAQNGAISGQSVTVDLGMSNASLF